MKHDGSSQSRKKLKLRCCVGFVAVERLKTAVQAVRPHVRRAQCKRAATCTYLQIVYPAYKFLCRNGVGLVLVTGVCLPGRTTRGCVRGRAGGRAHGAEPLRATLCPHWTVSLGRKPQHCLNSGKTVAIHFFFFLVDYFSYFFHVHLIFSLDSPGRRACRGLRASPNMPRSGR